MRNQKLLSLGLASIVLVGLLSSFSPGPGSKEKASVSIDCTRGSGLIQVNIVNHRKIGNVHIEVKDAKGMTVYIEEGKAMTDELVRCFDKGMFPKGAATLTVEARDFTITQVFTVQ